MSHILIVSKTKMANKQVCVGGIDLDNKLSVRLLDTNGFHESTDECPYSIRDLWNIEYQRHNQRPLPYSEDIRVTARNKIGLLPQKLSVIDLLRRLDFKIYDGNIRTTFESKLKRTNAGTFYISEDDVPNHSTCFWVCDKNIVREYYKGKVRYRYNDDSRQWGCKISYVGIEADPAQIISEGTLVRLSLANWWSPRDSTDEERCYLQLSGW
jgi:hypothetical protein